MKLHLDHELHLALSFSTEEYMLTFPFQVPLPRLVFHPRASHGYGTIVYFFRSSAAYKDRLTHGHHRGRSRCQEGLQPSQARRH
jgi:hypothetical protein